ncbi:hypothetical protein Q3V30_15370 [Erwinia pyri]|uniref:Uncharacterized protein n=1 Tax=Erwinia pyri TaxID=3062598 RepID=A0AA50DJ26_9GAMM|nr:hypothetical protein [Erwinia sp. DE2]WLS77837.1 hypothetical protein Q3V30_15370 [Erwinia sp. DE2]
MSGMKIGGGANGALGGGLEGIGSKFTDVAKKFDGESSPAGKNGSNGALNFGSSALSKIADHGIEFGNQGGSPLSLKEKSSSGSEGGQGVSGEQNSTLNSITQLLNAIVQLLKSKGGEEGGKTGTDAASGSGNSNTQEASGNGDMLTQLMEMIKKMLGQTDGTDKGDAAAKENGSENGSGTSGSEGTAGSGDIMTQIMDMIKKLLGQSAEGSDSASGSGTGSGSGSGTPAAQSSSGEGQNGQDGLVGKLGSALQMLGLGAILSAIQGSGGAGAQGGSESSK